MKRIKRTFENLIGRDNKYYQWMLYWTATQFPKKIVQKITKLNKKRSFIKKRLELWMSEDELSMIKKYLNPNDIMLEWGAGGSTVFFSRFVKKYYSIEHSYNWYYRAKKQAPSNVKIKCIPANIPRKSRLSPPYKPEQFIDYIKGFQSFKQPIFNKVLIDGRARTQCAKSILPYLNSKSLVFVHDYSRRSQYKLMLNNYEKVDEVKTGAGMVVLKPLNLG